MSQELRRRLFQELDSIVLIDPHTHINALDPASRTLADILGYHYYTELAHSAGMRRWDIEDPALSPREKVGRLIENLGPIDNTIQWSWFIEMAQTLFGFEGDRIDASNWETLYDQADNAMVAAEWADEVLRRSKLEAVFLTNDFDDRLEGFDTKKYIPCLRTDDLVFHLAKPEVRERLERASGETVTDSQSLRQAIGRLFEHFVAKGARACAISLPPDFSPTRVSPGRADSAIDALLSLGTDASESHKRAAANFVFWTLAEYCDDCQMAFDLMIGVNRNVYVEGVHQGRDLYDSRVSLIQYKELFNAFPRVKFPVSVLASVTNQELTSYAWIFPNVVTNGHWWYSNTPTFIEHDLAARLEAVPRTKQIGYYSDMYKLEFGLPKFAMYKRILAKVLAERFVIDRGWSEERAVELGRQVLRGNVETIFSEPVAPTVAEVERGPIQVEDRAPLAAAAVGGVTGGIAGVALDNLSGSLGIAARDPDAQPLGLGQFYHSRIEPSEGDEGEELAVAPMGGNDLGPLDLEERDEQQTQDEFAGLETLDTAAGSSGVLDDVELQESFETEETDGLTPLDQLDNSANETILAPDLPLAANDWVENDNAEPPIAADVPPPLAEQPEDQLEELPPLDLAPSDAPLEADAVSFVADDEPPPVAAETPTLSEDDLALDLNDEAQFQPVVDEDEGGSTVEDNADLATLAMDSLEGEPLPAAENLEPLDLDEIEAESLEIEAIEAESLDLKLDADDQPSPTPEEDPRKTQPFNFEPPTEEPKKDQEGWDFLKGN